MESSKLELLHKTLECADKVVSICNQTLSGNPLSQACREYGLDLLEFRRFAFYSNNAKTTEEKKEVAEGLLSGAERLLKEICGYVPEYNVFEFNKAYAFVLSQLPEREQKVVNYYYMQGMTLDEIAKVFNVTRERIRMMLGKAIGRLRYHTRKKVLLEGISTLELSEEIKQKQDNLRSELEKVDASVLKASETRLGVYALFSDDDLDVLKNEGIVTAYDLMNYISKVMQDDFGVTVKVGRETVSDETSIEVLGLSVRAYNALYRARVRTVGQLSALSSEQLRQTRNLGLKCYEEIVQKASKFGIKLSQGGMVSKKVDASEFESDYDDYDSDSCGMESEDDWEEG